MLDIFRPYQHDVFNPSLESKALESLPAVYTYIKNFKDDRQRQENLITAADGGRRINTS